MATEVLNEFDGIIGHSPRMQTLAGLIVRMALSGFAVLIRGESGTGKELIARSIPRHSQRVKAPFLPVNCGAIPESLMEAHLFGHQKGSFTSELPGVDHSAVGLLAASDEYGKRVAVDSE